MEIHPSFFKNLLVLLISGFLGLTLACAPKAPREPVDEAIVSDQQFPDMEKYKRKSDETQISLIKILAAEAEKFSWQGNYQDALFVYNQALVLADEQEEALLLEAIEATLERTPAKDIKEFSNIKNIYIPRSLLLYWMGVNYALEDNYPMAKEVLEEFLLKFPNHVYAGDAYDLVSIISKSFFDKHTIGCMLPLSGKYTVFGQRALTGIQMAASQLGERYGKEFKIIVFDTKADPLTAVEGVRQLHGKNVAGIVGPLLNVEDVGQAAQELGIPLLALTQKSEFPKTGDFLFANFITPEMQVETLSSYLFGHLGVTKVAMLYPEEKYGETYMNLFWDSADRYGVKVVGVEAYDGEKTDFTVPIQKLTGEYFPLPDFLLPEEEEELTDETGELPEPEVPAERNSRSREKEPEQKIEIDFEALFIPDSPPKVKLILPQLVFNDAAGMYLVGTNLWHNESLLKDARGYNKHAVITDGFFAESRNPRTQEFSKIYESVFETKPGFLEAISYDTASILFHAAMEEGIDSRQSLRDFLRSGKLFEGATGSTFFDSDGSAHRELFLMTIKKEKFVEITR